MHVHPAVYAIGIPLLLAAAAFVYFKRTMEGPTAMIVVVDRRTAKLARTRTGEAIKSGDLSAASVMQTSTIQWLRHESQAGPRRYRAEYTRLLNMVREEHAMVIRYMTGIDHQVAGHAETGA